jgi:hypothetical protein
MKLEFEINLNGNTIFEAFNLTEEDQEQSMQLCFTCHKIHFKHVGQAIDFIVKNSENQKIMILSLAVFLHDVFTDWQKQTVNFGSSLNEYIN